MEKNKIKYLIDIYNNNNNKESLGLQGDQTSYPKGNQPCIFIGRNDAEAPILWLPDAKNKLIGKDPDAGKD